MSETETAVRSICKFQDTDCELHTCMKCSAFEFFKRLRKIESSRNWNRVANRANREGRRDAEAEVKRLQEVLGMVATLELGEHHASVVLGVAKRLAHKAITPEQVPEEVLDQ